MSAQEHLNGQLFQGSIKGGTPQLFPTKELLADRARYPRGFTPQRQQEVTSATGLHPKRHHASRAGAIAGVRDTLAASTVPLEHMKGRGEGSVHWYAGPGVEKVIGEEAAGQYQPQGTHGSAYIREGRERTPTVIHELGHHVSRQIERTPHSTYDTPTTQGREEAYAENYAEKHFRDRRGREMTKTRVTADAWTQGGARGGSSGGFHEAFAAVRKQSPAVQTRLERIAARDQRAMRGLDHPLVPPGHVPGQLPLLAGTGDKQHPHFDWDYTDDDKKYRGLKRATPTKTDAAPRKPAWWQDVHAALEAHSN